MTTTEYAPSGCSCAPGRFGIERRVPDYSDVHRRCAAEMIECKFDKRRIWLSLGDIAPTGDRVDHVVDVHQASIVFQLVGVTIGGQRDLAPARLDGCERRADAGKRMHRRQVLCAVPLALR